MRTAAVFYWSWIIGLFFVFAGANHFMRPEPYLAMMPSYLPWPGALVALSGVAEILGGIGVLARPLRTFAGWGLIALLIAVFPANVNVALHGWPGVDLPRWILWARLPMQVLAVWWIHRVCVIGPKETRAQKTQD